LVLLPKQNVSSVSGLGGDWYQSIYNASKGAVANLPHPLALELGLRGVRVNAVNPSFTFTEMTRSFERHVPLMKKILERVPLGRGAKPAEVASIIAFLASKRVLLKKTITVSIDPRVE